MWSLGKGECKGYEVDMLFVLLNMDLSASKAKQLGWMEICDCRNVRILFLSR